MLSSIQRLVCASALRRIVCIAAFAGVVTGCTGSSGSPTPAINRQQEVVVAKNAAQLPPAVPLVTTRGFMSGEVFSAYNIVIKTSCKLRPSEHTSATFRAKGSATGPYPGSFIVNGDWGERHHGHHHYHYAYWVISGSFTISSKHHLIKGNMHFTKDEPFAHMTCKRFGPFNGIQYYRITNKHRVGIASTTGISLNGFSETFQ